MGKTADRELANAASLRRKADLLEAADNREFAADVAELRAAADLAEQYAAACDETNASRDAWNANPTDQAAKAAHKRNARDLHELRKTWRAMGQLAGTRGPVAVQNNTED